MHDYVYMYYLVAFVVYHNIAKPIISRGVKQDIKNNIVFGVLYRLWSYFHTATSN
jgi:hypothetical protein